MTIDLLLVLILPKWVPFNDRDVAPDVVRRCRSSGALAVEPACSKEVRRHQRKWGGEWMYSQELPSFFKRNFGYLNDSCAT